MSHRFRPTEALIADIANRVQGGAFPHVAAEAAGVPTEVFHDWMERGSQPGAREPYRSLAERVRHAHGHARCMAEIDLHTNNSKAWLLNGPGKNSDSLPGWSTPVKGQPKPERHSVNVLAEPQLQALLTSLLETLSPYPEARAALATALAARPATRPPGGSSPGRATPPTGTTPGHRGALPGRGPAAAPVPQDSAGHRSS